MSSQESRRKFLKSSVLGLGAGLVVTTAAGCATTAPATPSNATQPTATGKLAEVLKRGKVIVGTGSTNPPWHFEDQGGNLVGFDIEMGHLLSKGLFDDPNKVEFTRQASDARIPN